MVPSGSKPTRELRAIRRALRTIDKALKRLSPALQAAKSASNRKPGRRLTLSPKRRAALKLHGRYIGTLRQLKPAQKKQVKALYAAKGYHAAIKVARNLTAGRKT